MESGHTEYVSALSFLNWISLPLSGENYNGHEDNYLLCLYKCEVHLHNHIFTSSWEPCEEAEVQWLAQPDTGRTAEQWNFLAPRSVLLPTCHSCCLFRFEEFFVATKLYSLSIHFKAHMMSLFWVFLYLLWYVVFPSFIFLWYMGAFGPIRCLFSLIHESTRKAGFENTICSQHGTVAQISLPKVCPIWSGIHTPSYFLEPSG